MSQPIIPHRQSGFTLIELLIALALTLVIVVAVQRYVAGVSADQTHLTNQQDQTAQTFIVLSNIQRDVARAGFTPLAANPNAGIPAPIEIKPCTINACKGDELTIRYWQYSTGAVYDCVGHEVAKTDNWALVENTYRVRTSSELACSGNGGKDNDTFALLGNVHSLSWRLDADSASGRLLHICLTTKMDQADQVAGGMQPKSCDNNMKLSIGKAYRTTELDVLVRPQAISLGAGMEVPQ